MPDDWSWFWAGEGGRDRLLREELEGLQATASASSAQSARLSSQLRRLQGSMESRLQALSTAFDAYVELGDVREQLAGYPDTSAIRRDVAKGLAVLGEGGVPERVDGRGVDYWLVDAMNEVIDLASGVPRRASAPAPSSQEHEMFVVAALGWLGHGERVGDRVAPLLTGDGALAAPQVLLWRAVVHGEFGDVLDAVRSVWLRDLDLSAPGWDAFAQDAARTPGPIQTLRWMRDLLRGEWAPTREADAASPDDRSALRSLVDALVGAGLGDERALLERARVLRARIEEPGAPEADPRAEPPRSATTTLVQQALLDPDVAPASRLALAGWVRPGLEAAAAGIAARVAAEEPAPVVARTEVGDVAVGTAGPDPARLAQLDTNAVQRSLTPRSRLLVPGAAAGVTLVVGLVLLATHLAGLGVFLLVVAAVLGVVLIRELLAVRRRKAELAELRQRIRDRVEQARAAAVATRTTSLETRAEVAGLARSVTTPEVPAEPGLH
jgi:hypothetical protein